MEQIITIILPLTIGYVLDLIFGDPRKMPHPIVGFGNTISFFTKKLNHGKHRILKGACMSFSLALGVFLLFWLFGKLLLQIDSMPVPVKITSYLEDICDN